MNNKPVAWMSNEKEFYVQKNYCPDFIPLYTQDQLEEARKLGMQQERALWNLSESTQEIMNTHPADLTDEEIQEIAHGFGEIAWLGDTTYDFARAILRKAQEK